MSLTPNSAHSPHVAGTTNQNPAVLNMRRPGPSLHGAAASAAEGEVLMASVVEEAPPKLPPTALRLPNLATVHLAGQSRVAKILSILHWIGIGLGALFAWFLIFYGQNGSPEDFSTAKDTSVEVEASPEWKAPPLPSAGDSQAPKWTPPALAPEAAEAPAFQPAPAPASHDDIPAHQDETAAEAPSFESWPRQDAAEEPSMDPELSALDQAAQGSPAPPNPAGPVARTAQREMPDYEPFNSEPLNSPHNGAADSDEVQPLGITVPVPQ